MSSLTNYKGLQVVSPSPVGAGGAAINNDFKSLVDWSPKSKWDATSNPTTGDDTGDDFQVGSLWFNTTDDVLFLCTDSTTGSAVWVNVPINCSFKSGRRTSDLTINSTTLVSTGLTFPVKTNETWTFEFYLFATQLDSAANLRVQVVGPAGGSNDFGRYAITCVTPNQVLSAAIGIQSGVVNVNESSSSDDMFVINGIIIAQANGNVELRIRNNQGNSADIQTFSQYSYFVARRIG